MAFLLCFFKEIFNYFVKGEKGKWPYLVMCAPIAEMKK